RGARRAIEARGGSIVCFAGAGLDDPDLERRARGRIFDFVDRSRFDGILCLSTVLGHYVGVPGIERWLLQRELMACSVGPAEHVPSVMVDDATGITQLTRHLIRHHQHRHIAFVTGNPSNAEAQRRLSAYIQVLTDHGLTFDPRLTITGDFTPESGARAVHELLDARHVRLDELDAVVCSNDSMAFGVIEELRQRGIPVPDGVAVVGFDDVPAARTHQPSLTTVRQPLEDLGRKAAVRLLGLLDGGTAEGAAMLDCELVLRRSCGCVPTELPAPVDEHETLLELAGRHVAGLSLEDALAQELHGAPGAFTRVLEPYLQRFALGNTKKLEQGRRFADELAARVRLAREDLVHQRLSRLARVLHQRMFGPEVGIAQALAEHMPEFGLYACAVSQLVARQPGDSRDTLRYAFGFDAHGAERPNEPFDARDLLPPSFDELGNASSLVLPLTFGKDTLGIAVLPPSDRDGPFYEVLAELLGTVLKVLELRRGTERG
ncbi:MAG TPA: substrate-binding domain-containing protein, partial [Polyangiaceae bacterium]|nr:substrate-binding domain-containing protein [Polyangiaceae bacterium]